jgi:hypothetical protein
LKNKIQNYIYICMCEIKNSSPLLFKDMKRKENETKKIYTLTCLHIKKKKKRKN